MIRYSLSHEKNKSRSSKKPSTPQETDEKKGMSFFTRQFRHRSVYLLLRCRRASPTKGPARWRKSKRWQRYVTP